MTSKMLKIGEMQEKFGVTLRALRFYENKGVLSPTRKGATRLYPPKEVAKMSNALRLKKIGVPVEEWADIVDCKDKTDETILRRGQSFIDKLNCLRQEAFSVFRPVQAVQEG